MRHALLTVAGRISGHYRIERKASPPDGQPGRERTSSRRVPRDRDHSASKGKTYGLAGIRSSRRSRPRAASSPAHLGTSSWSMGRVNIWKAIENSTNAGCERSWSALPTRKTKVSAPCITAGQTSIVSVWQDWIFLSRASRRFQTEDWLRLTITLPGFTRSAAKAQSLSIHGHQLTTR